MKNTIKRTLLIAILVLLSAATSFAQLKVSLHIDSHPDPYLSNWPNIQSTVIVTVTNSGKNPVAAKFDCKVNLNGALEANTKPESMQTLQIAPGVTQYFARDLVPFEAVKIANGADRTAVKTGMLPAGDYEFCVSLIDPSTNAQLTPPVCSNFTLVSYQGPILLQPETGSTLGKTQRLPMFRWTGVSPKYPSPVSYRVVVFEILKGQTPVTAFRVNRPILDETVSATQLMWPADVDLPKEGMQYVWSVQALDDSGHPIIDQANGFSEPSTFFACCGDTSGNDDKEIFVHQHKDTVIANENLDPLTILYPLYEAALDSNGTVPFSWVTSDSASSVDLPLTFSIVKMKEGQTQAEVMRQIPMSVKIGNHGKTLIDFRFPNSSTPSFTFEVGGKYAWWLSNGKFTTSPAGFTVIDPCTCSFNAVSDVQFPSWLGQSINPGQTLVIPFNPTYNAGKELGIEVSPHPFNVLNSPPWNTVVTIKLNSSNVIAGFHPTSNPYIHNSGALYSTHFIPFSSLHPGSNTILVSYKCNANAYGDGGQICKTHLFWVYVTPDPGTLPVNANITLQRTCWPDSQRVFFSDYPLVTASHAFKYLMTGSAQNVKIHIEDGNGMGYDEPFVNNHYTGRYKSPVYFTIYNLANQPVTAPNAKINGQVYHADPNSPSIHYHLKDQVPLWWEAANCMPVGTVDMKKNIDIKVH